MDYFDFVLCRFCTMEYVFFDSFLIAPSVNIKVHTHFKENFKALRLCVSNGTFLTNYDVTNRKLKPTKTYSIVRKQTKWERNIATETTRERERESGL